MIKEIYIHTCIVESLSDIVQLLSHTQLLATPWTAACPVLHYLPEFAQVNVSWVGDVI